METADLLRVRHEGAVDEVVGRIQDVDMPADKKSPKTGLDEICQDIVIELPDRTKVVIAFWELSQRCFSRDGSMKDLVVFPRDAVGYWVRVRDTNPRDKHSLSRRTQGRAPKHYADKRGVPVYLKATPTVSVEWLLNEGQSPPRMGPPRRVKKPKPLEVPGPKTGGGSKKMSQQDVPGRRGGGTNQGGSTDRRPPTTQPPAGRQEQRREQEPPPAEPTHPVSPYEVHGDTQTLSKLMSVLFTSTLGYIEEAFEFYGMSPPPGSSLKTVASTITIAFEMAMKNSNAQIESADPKHITALLQRLCGLYALVHKHCHQAFESKKRALFTEQEMVDVATGRFIALTRRLNIRLPRPKQSR